MNLSVILISALEAHQLLDDGCQGFLAVISDQNRNKVKFEEIPVVQEFPNSFLEELLRLPPEREVEFVIELAARTEPVSKAPYKMALTELKELKGAIAGIA